MKIMLGKFYRKFALFDNIKFFLLQRKVPHQITIQWHITTKCQNNCKHCYMYEPRIFQREQSRILTLKQKIDILDQLDEFGKKYNFEFKNFILIGGDPLLATDVFDLVKELKNRGKNITFAGNPETLTDENCRKLKKYGILSYQLSIDGLEKTHDSIRGKGSFQRTINGYEQLDRYGIHATTMITISNINANEFSETIDYVFHKTKSKGIVFDFCVHIGNAQKIAPSISPELALDICNRYLAIKSELKCVRSDFHFAEKSGFLRLLHIQRKEILFIKRETTDFNAGCLIGHKCQCIFSDGTVALCRRLPIILGRLPEDSFENIYLSNEILKKYRRPQYFDDCGNCIGWNWCRGCPGISDGESGNPFKKPQICFSHLLGFETHNEHRAISMQTTLEEEANIIRNNTRQKYNKMIYGLGFPYRVLLAILKLKKNTEYSKFSKNTKEWFFKNMRNLNEEEQDMVIFHCNRKKQ